MKYVHRIRTKQHGGMKSNVLRPQNSTISQMVCAGPPSFWKM